MTFVVDGDLYHAKTIPCDIGGQAFEVKKAFVTQSPYHVIIGPDSCECMGFLRHGYCRHIRGLKEALNDPVSFCEEEL